MDRTRLRIDILLENPLNEVLRLGRPDFPFCVCWANEPWTRNWDGKPGEILMPQEHTSEADERFIVDLLPMLRDERYIRINGRPLLLVYRTELLPDLARTVLVWREVASKNCIYLYLCRVESFAREDLASIHFDAACEFPPNISGIMPGAGMEGFEGNLFNYPELHAAAPAGCRLQALSWRDAWVGQYGPDGKKS